jgi:hypothetical protein
MTNKKYKTYMNLGLHLEGRDPVFLRVPTRWDAVELQWLGFVQLPVSKKIIHATGQSSFDLENNFNMEISKVLQDSPHSEEVFSLFKSNEEWEKEEISLNPDEIRDAGEL